MTKLHLVITALAALTSAALTSTSAHEVTKTYHSPDRTIYNCSSMNDHCDVYPNLDWVIDPATSELVVTEVPTKRSNEIFSIYDGSVETGER